MSIELDELKHKYQNCAEFNHLVKMMEHVMLDGKITPQDIRDAAFIAGIHIAMRDVITFGVSNEEMFTYRRSPRRKEV